MTIRRGRPRKVVPETELVVEPGPAEDQPVEVEQVVELVEIEDELAGESVPGVVAETEMASVKKTQAELIEESYQLSYSEALEKIGHKPSSPPNEKAAREVIAWARAWGIPLHCMNWISAGKSGGGSPYIRHEGVLFKLQNNEDGPVSEITTELVHFPSKENQFTAVTKARIVMADGRIFNGYGAISQSERPDWGLGNLVLMSETKAIRRAGMNALGVPFPSYDDREDWDKQQAASSRQFEREFTKPSAEVKKSINAGTIVANALKKGMGIKEILDKLGVTEIGQIADLEEAERILFGGNEVAAGQE